MANENAKFNKYIQPILVVARSGSVGNQLRLALKTIGYSKVSAVSSHVAGLQRLRSRSFYFVLFEALSSDMKARDFVKQACELENEPVLIAVSDNPGIDDVFGLLKEGARGYLAIPFSTENVEQVLDRAREGPPFSEAVLQAPDRNAALAGVVLNNLYRVSVIMRQAREFQSAQNEVDRFKCNLSEAVELALLFCEDGENNSLRQRIVDDCVARAELAASRLGRTRIRLKKERESKPEDEEDDF